MQLSPRAETSRSLLPSVRFCIVLLLSDVRRSRSVPLTRAAYRLYRRYAAVAWRIPFRMGLRTTPGVVSRLGDLHAVRFEGDAVGVRSAAHSGAERVDRGYLLAGELEVEDVEILGDAGGLGRLRDRGSALLQVPAQHHLSGRLAVLARDLTQRRVVECALLAAPVGGDAPDGRPGLGKDAVLGVQTLQRGLLEVRVELDLVQGGTTDVSASRRSRCSGMKLLTPMAHTLPSAISFSSAR